MTLATETVDTLRGYWGDRLGVGPEAFAASTPAVGAADQGGVQVFFCDDARVVGAPESTLDACERRADTLATLDGDEAGGVRAWLDAVASVDETLGPTFYGYADATTFDAVDADARVLDAEDEAAFDHLRAAVPADEWDRGAPEFRPGDTVGRFVDDDLVAVAGYAVWDGLIAHVGVVSHPDHRDAGHGRAVVSLATERALAAGLLPQYRTADAWPWSVALARGLGYERFATAYLGVLR
jgi:GNAT superfamily N-acetyltransferase